MQRKGRAHLLPEQRRNGDFQTARNRGDFVIHLQDEQKQSRVALLSQMLSNSTAIELKANTRIRVLEIASGQVRSEVIEGEHKGKQVFTTPDEIKVR